MNEKHSSVAAAILQKYKSAIKPKRGDRYHRLDTEQIKRWLLWKTVQNPNGCWDFIGGTVTGYGLFRYRGENKLAHRVSYELFIGPIPEGMYICHHCDRHGCINPTHLFAGTQKDNVRDMMAKGRANQAKGENTGSAKLKEFQVLEIKRLLGTGRFTQKELGIMFNISKSVIEHINLGLKWKYLWKKDGRYDHASNGNELKGPDCS